MSSNHSNHYLFGLHPSKLSVIPGKNAMRLRKLEGRLWRIPNISAKLIKTLKSRFNKPHRYVLLLPLAFITSQDTPIYSIPQYVHIMKLVNSQLIRFYHEKTTNSKLSIPNFRPLKHLLLSYKTKSQFAPTFNDTKIGQVVHQIDAVTGGDDLDYAYKVWAKTCNPNKFIQTIHYEFEFTPYYRSLTNAGCVVLTPKAARMYQFAEDYSISVDHVDTQYFRSNNAQRPQRAKLVKTIKQNLRHLRRCEPIMYKQYHQNIIQQVHYSLYVNRNRTY